MLFRGQNILGYRHYSDDVVEYFVQKSIANGIDIIRIFDALNDERNMEVAMKAIKKYGGVCEATICYTSAVVDGQEVFTDEYFVNLAKQLEERGADKFVILEEKLVSELYGVGFLKGNTELRDQVQETLYEMVKDGKFDEIAKKWDLQDSVVLGK